MLPRIWNWLMVSVCLCSGVACGHTASRKQCDQSICHKSAIPALACEKTFVPTDSVSSLPIDPFPTSQAENPGDHPTVILPPGFKLGEVFRPAVLPPAAAPEFITKYQEPPIEQPL